MNSHSRCRPSVVLTLLLTSLVTGWIGIYPSQASESAENIFPDRGVGQVRVSPDGKWVVAGARRGPRTGVLVQRLGSSEITNAFVTEDNVSHLTWVDRQSIFVWIQTPTGQVVLLLRFDYRDGKVVTQQSTVRAIGRLIDPLPLVDREVIWAFNYDGRASLHRVTLKELEDFGQQKTNRGEFILPGEPLADLAGTVDKWIVDKDGEPRVLQRKDEAGYTILWRPKRGRDFEKVYRYDFDDREKELTPVAMSADGTKVSVIAYNGKNTLGVHVFDPKTRDFVETIFLHPDVDVSRVEIDHASHQIFAAVYEVDGEERYHYLASYGEKILSGLTSSFPKDSIEAISISIDRRLFVFRVADSMNPGAYYIRDVLRAKTTLLAQQGANIDLEALSPSSSFVVESADETKVEAFLTLPKSRAGRPAPLIVMPHGGPNNVRDSREYDALVQYLASWGFAVLQPNYRGSAGYGLDFVKAGKKQWARGIEDDIDAAVDHATSLTSIDGDRICIVGGSYGGFSALASIVRHKDRYACAISWNGASDIPLLYDSSDFADSKKALDFYEEFVGDLETERDKLVDASPVYHVNKIETPVFLIYGTEDRRVDPDHSHRMMLMLELYGKEFESLEVKDMAHGATRREAILVARAMRRYLTKYLEPSQSYKRDPITESEQSIEFIEAPKVDF